MLFLIKNQILVQNRPVTYLTTSIAATATTLSVKAVDTNEWADNNYIIIGEIGSPTAEIMQINGAVTDGVSLTIDRSGGAGGTRFSHNVDDPVYRIDFDKFRTYHAATVDGAKTLLATVEIMPNEYESIYDDQTNTSGYGFVRFFNSTTLGQSPYSDAIPYTGQSPRSLQKMIAKCRSLMDEQSDDFITDGDIKDAINDKQRDILDDRLWTFNETTFSTYSIQYQFDYSKPEGIKTLYSVRFGTQPLRAISQSRWEMLHWDTNQNTTTPTHVAVWNNDARIYPTPSAGAQTTNLDGAISATDTTITVNSGSGFLIGDYYRFTIDDEIIYATFFDDDTNQFTGCLRGQEGTTAASHLDDALVTQNDIVFMGQAEPQDLEELNDETVVPEALVICYGVSADFCNGKINKPTLGDRYQKKYEDGLNSLRDKYAIKITSQFGRVKDPREVVMDNGRIQNPNDFPQNVIAPPLSGTP